MGLDGPVCFGCDAYEPAEDERLSFGWWLMQLAFWALVAFWLNEQLGVLFVIIAWATMALAVPLDTLIHEAGHAVAARLVGFELLSVQIGRGPELWGGRLGSTQFSLRRYAMLGGATHTIIPDGAAAWRRALLFLGGPLASLSVAAPLFVFLARDHPSVPVRDAVATGLMILAARTVVNTLWPRSNGEGRPDSDGAQFLALFRRAPPATADLDPRLPLMLAAQRLQRAGRHAQAADLFVDKLREWPNDPYLLGMVIHCTSRAAGDRAALARYRALVAEAPAGPPRPFDWHGTMVGWLAANIAWSTLKSAPDADLDDADLDLVDLELQTALEHAPEAPEIKATLGASYVARGPSEAGERLLVDAMRVVEDPLDRADFCRFVAKGRRDRGDEDGAIEAERLRDHILTRPLLPKP